MEWSGGVKPTAGLAEIEAGAEAVARSLMEFWHVLNGCPVSCCRHLCLESTLLLENVQIHLLFMGKGLYFGSEGLPAANRGEMPACLGHFHHRAAEAGVELVPQTGVPCAKQAAAQAARGKQLG